MANEFGQPTAGNQRDPYNLASYQYSNYQNPFGYQTAYQPMSAGASWGTAPTVGNTTSNTPQGGMDPYSAYVGMAMTAGNAVGDAVNEKKNWKNQQAMDAYTQRVNEGQWNLNEAPAIYRREQGQPMQNALSPETDRQQSMR